MSGRAFTLLDRFIVCADEALSTVFGTAHSSGRADPSEGIEDTELSDFDRRETARMMRVNHVGEVCAQALYQSQALTARTDDVRRAMRQAADEENDHLLWCDRRIRQLGGRKSALNPVWYGGAFVIGAVAGLAGDKWNLGFVAETEKQVVDHLDRHLARLPEEDQKSRAILAQMKEDEAAHATTALRAGAAPLPEPVRRLMHRAGRVMTSTAHWI